MSKPGNPDALSWAKLCDTIPDFIDLANNLMTWNERLSMQVEVAFDDMNVGPANGAYVHLDSNLALSRLRLIDFLQNQRRFTDWSLLGQNHRSHRVRKAESGKPKVKR